jgi:hypothetical protein
VELDWPVTATYVPGKLHRYPWKTAESTAWPGQILVATLESAAVGLGLVVRAENGETIAKGEQTPFDTVQAAFICPPEQTCSIEVRALAGQEDVSYATFDLMVDPAAPQLENMVSVPGRVRDMLEWDGRLYTALPGGVRVFEASSSLAYVSDIMGMGLGGATGVEICGAHLCVSRLGLKGLKIVDVADPENPSIEGDLFTVGLGWDLAVDGSLAYLAHGILGVGIYDVSDPESPAWIDQIWPGGRITSVAVQRNLVAAGSRQGAIYLYEKTKQGLVYKGEVQAKGKISKVGFVSGSLWVVGKKGRWVEVYDTGDAEAPEKLGEMGGSAERFFHAVLRGSRAYTFKKKHLEVYHVQP